MRRFLGIHRMLVLWVLLLAGMVLGYALSTQIWPEASGSKVYSKGNLRVDASHAEDGYVMVSGPETNRKLKVRLVRGDVTMTYDLNGVGEYEVLPLQQGSGYYTCSLYKNIKSNRYSQEGSVEFRVELTSEDAPFLCPSQYVNYTQDSPAVALSMKICEGLETAEEKYEAICRYIRTSFVYDYVKAATVSPGSMPDVDGCVEKHMGICQDLAAVTACMLRVQGIPARLVIGYADQNYHAWNSVRIDGEYVLFDPTAELKAISKKVTYTEERYY